MTPTRSRRRFRDAALIAGLAALLAVGLWGAARDTSWAEIRETLLRLSVPQVAILLALSLGNYALRGLRWHVFAARLGLPCGPGTNLLHFLAGFAMTVTPGRVGELVRMRWLRRETGWAYERTAPLVLVDRAADLAAMAVLLGAALVLVPTPVKGALPVAVLSLLAAFVVTRPTLLATLARTGHRATGRFARLFARIRRGARALAVFSRGGALAVGTGLGLVGWLAEAWSFHLLLMWLGADVPAATAIVIFTFATLAGGLTGAPGGVGGAEAAMIALLGLEGVPMAIAIPATALIRLTTLWFAILIGAVLFPVTERRSRRIAHELENA